MDEYHLDKPALCLSDGSILNIDMVSKVACSVSTPST